MDDKPERMFNVILQSTGDKIVLVQNWNAYEIDEVGARIWELCDGAHTVEEMAHILKQEYAADYDQLLADCREFIEDIRALELLE